MPAKKNKSATESFNLWDRVKIRYTDWRGRIVELRGPLGPGGAQVYRVRVPGKPKPMYVEVLGDQLILIPKPAREPFKLGDRVGIRYSKWRGRIVELRGPLAPGGVQVYRIRIPTKPEPTYIEVREDQLIRLRPKAT